MPSHRRPKGAYIRDTPDWFADRLAIASASQAAAPGMVSQVWIHNNSMPGVYLHVYGVTAIVDVASIVLFTKGVSVSSSVVRGGAPIVGGAPLPPGEVSASNPGSTPLTIGMPLGLAAGVSKEVFPSMPLAILPPGNDYRATTLTTNVTLYAAFFYVWLQTIV